MDILFSVVALFLTAPFYLLVAFLIWVDGLLRPENAGPIMDPYIAASAGRKFLKLKFRTLKWSDTDTVSSRLDFQFRPSEHVEQNLTFVGRFLKQFYLDEIPQMLNVLRGEMSLVGPRPLAWHHYLRTLEQGHPLRRLLKAGLFSPTHVRKGETSFPDMTFDYEYVEMYSQRSAFSFLWQDILVIMRGIRVVLEGRGL
jgi:lipopolysaccharide/colanic/teichoic acid biosynthesis glycosyltransferase